MTLHLRGNTTFSNGDALDADDVVWSFNQIISKKYVGYERLGSVASVSADDSSTVVLTLREPDATLLRALSGRSGIVYDSTADLDYTTQALGSGPFIVGRHTSRFHHHPATQRSVQTARSGERPSHLHPPWRQSSLLEVAAEGKVSLVLPPGAPASQISQTHRNESSQGSSIKVMLAFNCGTDSLMSDGAPANRSAI